MTDRSKAKDPEVLNRTLLTEGNFASPNEEIDLTNCDKEPIHIPGLIQPHGVLLAVTNTTEQPLIVQCSRNVDPLLGRTTEELLGRPLEDVVGKAQLAAMQKELGSRTFDPSKLHYMNISIEVGGDPVSFYGIMHESEDLLILELEPASDKEEAVFQDYEWVQTFFCKMKRAGNRVEASQMAAEQIKEMLGYDRVMVYEFDEEWNGKVIAEAKEEGLEPFLGHHYPASDIPKQARELYLRNWLRMIVDVYYKPVEIVPTLHPATGRPLNLSLSVLRSVSPLHIEYLQNMGVGATTTISLIHDNKLWGLVTCHHYTPKYIPHRVRNLCNFLGFFFSSELYQRQQLDDYQTEIELKTMANRISNIFIGNTSANRVMEQLKLEEKSLLQVMNASGVAVCYKDKLALFGGTPEKEQIRELAFWMSRQADDYEYHTSRLSQEHPPAAAYKKTASGALYLALSPDGKDYVIWFRPEVVQVVNWAGDPSKAVLRENDGVRLSPRKSFEKWRQVVESSSLPWKIQELRQLSDLKSIMLKQTENQMRQAEEQAQQNSRILKENEKRYLQLMELSPVAFFTITDNRVVYCNEQGAELFEAANPEELIGKAVANFVHPEFLPVLQRKMAELDANALSLFSMSGRYVTVSGGDRQLEITMASVVYDGKPSLFAIARRREEGEKEVFSEVSNQLQTFINTDSLTEMPNRRFFDENLEKEWKRAAGAGSPVSLILMDIDHFKAYNALYGYQGGDTCLQWMSDILVAIGKPNEAVIARYGGGTFVLRLEAAIEKAVDLAEQIRLGVLSMKIPQTHSDSGDYLTVSLGVSSAYPEPGSGPDDLVYAAERALQKAKNEGRNRVSVIRPV
ncbi:diguanylate cyclase domain-containing protein [Paenibacillus chitinolyticus]|uniref:diguanylate cyclase domain-containing protein n=1 Tax=Paenibacillus chitinolyticus TaxID=79263 RepID=UPI003556B7A3